MTMTMFEGKRLIDTAAKSAADLFGDPRGETPADLVPRLERALAVAKQLATMTALDIPVDDQTCGAVARLGALLDGIDECFPLIEAWCVVKHYVGISSNPEPVIQCAFLSKDQAEAFAKEIAKAYAKPGRQSDRWLVERRAATLSDFIAPTVTAKAYADEIRSYS
jgi:hypothetical protein